MQIDKIRRGSDGTIDIDAYLKEAHALQAQAFAQLFKWLGRTTTECFLRIGTAFVKHTQHERSISAGYLGWRWCDSTERELSDELMGRHGWFNSKPV
jgi:hypothetical protein